jgi:hypothetical protein
MHTYKLDKINYKDGEFYVRFVPNSEPIEFVVSGKYAGKFFDSLKANGYKTDELYIDVMSKKHGHSADAICLNVPCASGCGSEPGRWIECKFESEPEQDEECPSIVRRIQMGKYNGKPLHWIYLGHYDDETDLFLSEDIICERRFDSESNDWFNSELAKWLAVEFLDEAFTQSEYPQLVPIKSNGLFGHKLFLLSKDEYEKYRNEIPRKDNRWWLRSPSKETCKPAKVATVKYDGSVNAIGFYVNEDFIGVRPALRLRRG